MTGLIFEIDQLVLIPDSILVQITVAITDSIQSGSISILLLVQCNNSWNFHLLNGMDFQEVNEFSIER